jgi:hypothetical protein
VVGPAWGRGLLFHPGAVSPACASFTRHGGSSQEQKDRRDRKIFEMWMACHTQEEIAAARWM